MSLPESNPLEAAKGFPWQRLWRSAALGWAATAVFLFIGLPIYFCMPPGVDTTLYDTAVRAVLGGGTHYRDVFDTNLPGIVWCMALIRATCGWSTEVLRVWDLLIVGSSVALLARWVRRAGGTGYSVAWFAAGVVLFYPYASQHCHCQRDSWMLLPALAATGLRFRRLSDRIADSRTGASDHPARWWNTSFIEGCCWGLGVWIKPHVMFPAVAVWCVSVFPLVSKGKSTRREAALDLCGPVAGGAVVGALGIAWLCATGTWPYFFDVFTNWNPEYAQQVLFNSRIYHSLDFFPPFSAAHLIAVPVAVISIWEFRRWPERPTWLDRRPWIEWLYSRASDERTTAARAMLGAFYLAWFFQAWLFQTEADYIHVPETLLVMAVVAGQRWALGFAGTVWLLAGLAFMRTAGTDPDIFQLVQEIQDSPVPLKIPNHPLGRSDLAQTWLACVRSGGTPEVRDRVQQFDSESHSTDWEELERVADFLRGAQPPLGDGELICWNDATHSLYLELGVKPALRYMHWNTPFIVRSKVDDVCQEVARAPHRFVVSDFQYLIWNKKLARAPGLDGRPEQLPYWFPRSQQNRFPWNQPIVFRSGRYAVHHIVKPVQAREIEPPLQSHIPSVLKPGLNEWAGSTDRVIDLQHIGPAHLESLGTDALLVINDTVSWNRFQQTVELTPRSGTVDFSRFLAVVALSRGPEIRLATRTQHGDLQTRIESPRNVRPGSRFSIIIVPHDGVQSVNGTPLRPVSITR